MKLRSVEPRCSITFKGIENPGGIIFTNKRCQIIGASFLCKLTDKASADLSIFKNLAEKKLIAPLIDGEYLQIDYLSDDLPISYYVNGKKILHPSKTILETISDFCARVLNKKDSDLLLGIDYTEKDEFARRYIRFDGNYQQESLEGEAGAINTSSSSRVSLYMIKQASKFLQTRMKEMEKLRDSMNCLN